MKNPSRNRIIKFFFTAVAIIIISGIIDVYVQRNHTVFKIALIPDLTPKTYYFVLSDDGVLYSYEGMKRRAKLASDIAYNIKNTNFFEKIEKEEKILLTSEEVENIANLIEQIKVNSEKGRIIPTGGGFVHIMCNNKKYVAPRWDVKNESSEESVLYRYEIICNELVDYILELTPLTVESNWSFTTSTTPTAT